MNQINKIKKYIKNYNIVDPNWEDLPSGFLRCDTHYLTSNEKIALKTIKLAWINEHKIEYATDIFGYSLIGGTAMIVLVFIVTSLLYYTNVKYHLGITFLTDFFA